MKIRPYLARRGYLEADEMFLVILVIASIVIVAADALLSRMDEPHPDGTSTLVTRNAYEARQFQRECLGQSLDNYVSMTYRKGTYYVECKTLTDD